MHGLYLLAHANIKWMIWGYHHFRKLPYFHIWGDDNLMGRKNSQVTPPNVAEAWGADWILFRYSLKHPRILHHLIQLWSVMAPETNYEWWRNWLFHWDYTFLQRLQVTYNWYDSGDNFRNCFVDVLGLWLKLLPLSLSGIKQDDTPRFFFVGFYSQRCRSTVMVKT